MRTGVRIGLDFVCFRFVDLTKDTAVTPWLWRLS